MLQNRLKPGAAAQRSPTSRLRQAPAQPRAPAHVTVSLPLCPKLVASPEFENRPCVWREAGTADWAVQRSHRKYIFYFFQGDGTQDDTQARLICTFIGVIRTERSEL